MPAKNLDRVALHELSRCTAPCITLILPDHHPGAPEGARRTILRGLLKSAAEELERGPYRSSAKSLLEPLEEACDEAVLTKGGRGWAVFRAPGFLALYRISTPAAKVSVGRHFLLAPFVNTAGEPAEAFILGLSTRRLRLFERTRDACFELPLPKGVPASLEEAGLFDRHERGLENRSTAGRSTGDLQRVRFGTATDRDTTGAYLHDFFEKVHRELKPWVARGPLVLLGVREEITAYQRAARNEPLTIAGAHGNIESLSTAEIGEMAREAIASESHRRAEQALAQIQEATDRRRVVTNIAEVLRLAAQGRIHWLCVRADTAKTGPDGEDLINRAIADTLRTSGEVFMVHQDKLPAARPFAALLRY